MPTENRTVPCAQKSPRNVNGVIFWYEGDTFPLKLTVRLTNDAGEAVDFASGDVIDVIFYAAGRKKEIFKSHFENIESGELIFNFDEELTKRFAAGQYVYDVIYNGVYRRTLAKGNQITVE